MKIKARIIITAIFISVFAIETSAQEIPLKIYLQKDVVAADETVDSKSVALKRLGNAKSPLRSALELLFKPNLTEEEQKKNIYEVTYGMKFEGVSLKNGTATVRFSETKDSNYGTSAAGIFSEAIEKTAKQFRSVKRVKICVVGKTNMDGDYEKRIFLPCK